jgi:hypothetical protein
MLLRTELLKSEREKDYTNFFYFDKYENCHFFEILSDYSELTSHLLPAQNLFILFILPVLTIIAKNKKFFT